MSKINKTQYALLGMLSIRPRSGYDIKTQIGRSIGFFWNENFGHIYPILKRMEHDGLVTKHSEETGKRPRKNVYTLTPLGTRELHRWLEQPATEQPVRNELLLKIFFGSRLDENAMIAMIEAEKKLFRERLEVLESVEKSLPTEYPLDLPYWLITLNYGKMKAAMTVEWCDQTIRALKRARDKKSGAR